MELTREIAERYVGGQLEVQDPSKRFLYRGEIATCTVTNDTLVITLKWAAKAESYPPISTEWANDPHHREFQADLMVWEVTDAAGWGRLYLNTRDASEVAVLFLPGDEVLAPSRVKGLNLAD